MSERPGRFSLNKMQEWRMRMRERLKLQNKTDGTDKSIRWVTTPNCQLASSKESQCFEMFHDPVGAPVVCFPCAGNVSMKPPLSPTSKGTTLSQGANSHSYGVKNTERLIKSEHVKEKLNVLRSTRLYLVRRPGPRIFLIASDASQHTYRVTIGKQECSCGKGPYCLHVLFVMLKVFQLPQNDSRLWSGSLKNYEVESLIASYEDRQQKCIAALRNLTKKPLHSSTNTLNTSTSDFAIPSRPQSMPDIRISDVDEEAKCPICLREMDDAEVVTICKTGCKNRLHQKCIGFWAAECQRQREPVICPLCRAIWPSQTFNFHGNENHSLLGNSLHSSSSSSVNSLGSDQVSASLPSLFDVCDENKHLVNCSSPLKTTSATLPVHEILNSSENFFSIKPNLCCKSPVVKYSHAHYLHCHQEKFHRWNEVYGMKLVNNLISADWSLRERGLCTLHEELVSLLNLASDESLLPLKHFQLMMEVAYEILAVFTCDPVYRVFVTSLRCFRSLLAYTACRSEEDRQTLKANVKPVIWAILMKCVDGNRQVNLLSTATIVELGKGLSGEFGVGKHTHHRDDEGIGGVAYILSCILEVGDCVGERSWRWWLGRLHMVDRLMDEFPQEFYLLHMQMYPSKHVGCNLSTCGYKLVHLERLLSILGFTVQLINHRHLKVRKMACRVFMLAARLTVHVPKVFVKVCNMLVTVDSHMENKLKESLKVDREFDVSSELLERIQKSSVTDDIVVYTSVFPPKLHNTSASVSLPFQNRSLVLEKLGPDLPPSAMYFTSPKMCYDDCNFPCLRNAKLLRGKRKVNKTKSSKCARNQKSPKSKFVSAHRFPFSSNLGRSCHSFKMQLRWTLLQQQFVDDKHMFEDENGRLGAPASSSCCSHVCECGRVCNRGSNSITDISPSSNFNCPVGNLIDLSGPSDDTTTVPFRIDDGENRNQQKSFILTNGANLTASNFDGIASSRDSCCWTEEESSDQNVLPIIPGLTDVAFIADDHLGTCKAEVTVSDEKAPKSVGYVEGSQWIRGQLLGTGAFSSCYQARDVMTGTLMAVKQVSFCRNTVDEQEAQRLSIRDEIILMMKLNHPNVVRLLGATLQGNHYNMFVEWMPGGSVAALLCSYGPFVDGVILRYIKQLLAGLAFLHVNQILHRDLKGANLLIDSTGDHLRIGDFGAAARLVSHRTVADEFKGQLLGTIAFMAPEVLRGEGYGRSCDVWSVGCVVIEMASGRPPWNVGNVSNDLALLYKIACCKEPPPMPPTISSVVKAVALLCLQPKSDDRPSATQLLNNSCFSSQC